MSVEMNRAMHEAEEAASGPFENFVENLARRVGARANASAVFGEPVTSDGVTVIPVAKVRWGFGGGGGRGTADKAESVDAGEGSGGGGGMTAAPLGYIELRGGTATFHRVRDPGAIVPVLLAGAFALWVASRALRNLFR